MAEYNAAATGITNVSFLVAGMGDHIDLERSYLEVELRLNYNSTNGIVADAHLKSDGSNTKFTYVIK